jgi:esterase/lipase
MLSRKTIFIIPGYRQKSTNKAYRKLSTLLKDEGFSPIIIDIPWKGTTISENTAYFLKEYRKIRTKRKYILGFSFGAMIAFLAATKADVQGLILCSLSPFFQEDLSRKIDITRSPMQADRYEDFSHLQSTSLVKQLKAKQILMVYGTKETRSLIKRVRETFSQIDTEKSLFTVKSTEHNISDRRYLQTIHQGVTSLL